MMLLERLTALMLLQPKLQTLSIQRNTKITQVAAKQIGNNGGRKFWSWYGFKNRVEWCACFVSWCANQCGYIKSGTITKFSSCAVGVEWFKGKKQWQKRSYKPKAGDIIFFDWGGDGHSDHVGIVEKCDGSTVFTIKSNKSLSLPLVSLSALPPWYSRQKWESASPWAWFWD